MEPTKKWIIFKYNIRIRTKDEDVAFFFYSIEMDTFPNMTKINRKSMPTIEAGVPPDFLMFLEDIPCRRLSLAWKPEKIKVLNLGDSTINGAEKKIPSITEFKHLE